MYIKIYCSCTYTSTFFVNIRNIYTEKNSSINFIGLFKSCGYRHLRNRVLELGVGVLD